jgi:hypothetical protein
LCEVRLRLLENINANQRKKNSLLQGIGSDSWRKLGGPVCDNKQFIRQELLDQIVWDEVVRLLQDPVLIPAGTGSPAGSRTHIRSNQET